MSIVQYPLLIWEPKEPAEYLESLSPQLQVFHSKLMVLWNEVESDGKTLYKFNSSAQKYTKMMFEKKIRSLSLQLGIHQEVGYI